MLGCLQRSGVSVFSVGTLAEAFQQLLNVELGIAISLGEFFLQLLLAERWDRCPLLRTW